MIYDSPPHLNGHIYCALDVETTGDEPGYHEIIQAAIVPLNSKFEVMKEVPPMHLFMRPNYPERAVHQALAVSGLSLDWLAQRGMSQEGGADYCYEWFRSLDLPHDRRIVGIAHGFPHDSSFLKAWLGQKLFDEIFHFHPRCSMALALSINDKCWLRGKPKMFEQVGLNYLCKRFGIENPNKHNAMSDAITDAEVYKRLLEIDIL